MYLFAIIKNRVYLQEYFAAFLWGVKMYRVGGWSIEIFEIKLLRTWGGGGGGLILKVE